MSEIKVGKVPAVSGYGSAAALMKPYIVYVDGKRLDDSRGRPRRFSSELLAREAAVMAKVKR